MDAVSLLVETLKEKKVLSQLESDIVETLNEFTKEPFHRPSALLRMELNYGRYPDIFLEAGLVSGDTAQPADTLTDEAVVANLRWQLLKLAEKKLKEQKHGQQT